MSKGERIKTILFGNKPQPTLYLDSPEASNRAISQVSDTEMADFLESIRVENRPHHGPGSVACSGQLQLDLGLPPDTETSA